MPKVLIVILSFFFILSFVRVANGRQYLSLQSFVDAVSDIAAVDAVDQFLETIKLNEERKNPLDLATLRAQFPDGFKWLASAVYYFTDAMLDLVNATNTALNSIVAVVWMTFKVAIGILTFFVKYLYA